MRATFVAASPPIRCEGAVFHLTSFQREERSPQVPVRCLGDPHPKLIQQGPTPFSPTHLVENAHDLPPNRQAGKGGRSETD